MRKLNVKVLQAIIYIKLEAKKKVWKTAVCSVNTGVLGDLCLKFRCDTRGHPAYLSNILGVTPEDTQRFHFSYNYGCCLDIIFIFAVEIKKPSTFFGKSLSKAFNKL